MNAKQKEDTATLELLQVIEKNSDVTQRHLAGRLDVALGLANSYLKRCVRKGLIKVQQAPANRYLYYLTPKGFSEKSRLTAEYLSASFNFYRQAGDSLTLLFNFCEEKTYQRILFCGVSELAEIASVRALEHALTVIGTWDPENNQSKYLHHPVWKNFGDIPGFDACILTSLDKASVYYDLLVKNTQKENVLVPSILGINVRQD